MLIDDRKLALISSNLPVLRPKKSILKAAVAIILRDTERGTEFLMMQRAKHERDPWSGQMSFPGGKIEPEDESAKAAAVREAYEEVGVMLSEADYIGQLDDLYGLKVDGIYSVHVACFVFKPYGDIQLSANHEVADMVWLPIGYLDDPENAHDYFHPKDESVKMPAVMIDSDKEQILWGLSLRMLAVLHELLDMPMNALNEDDKDALKSIENRNLDRSKLDSVTSKVLNKRR